MRSPLLISLLVACVSSAAHPAWWGLSADFADLSIETNATLAPMLARSGVNAVSFNIRGPNHNWPHWQDVQRTWTDAKISCFWDSPTTLAETERFLGFEPGGLGLDDRAVMEDGTRAWFGARPRLGNFFDPGFSMQTRRVTTALANRLKGAAGYRISSDAVLGDGSHDPASLNSWRVFLRRLFADDTPDSDTNGDTTTFNQAFGTGYLSWEQTPRFGSVDMRDPVKRRLTDFWLADSYAAFVESVSRGLKQLDPKLVLGPGVGSSVVGSVDSSLLAAGASTGAIFATSVDAAASLRCASAALGKSVVASGIELVPGDTTASRMRAMRLLPYVSGAFFDAAGLVKPASEAQSTSAPVFDPAFSVIPELAPFVGQFTVPGAEVLWILSPGGDSTIDGHLFNADTVSEHLLALSPDSCDFARYKLVIYRSNGPSLSTLILQKLFSYALKGGCVIVDAFRVADGPTVTGRSNAMFWWERLKPVREKSLEGETKVSFAGSQWTIPGVLPYLARRDDKLEESGEVTDSTGAKYALAFTRLIGDRGKWVMLNLPGVIESRPAILRHVARETCGVDIPDPSRARVYSGHSCVLAIGGEKSEYISYMTAWEKSAVFDVGERTGSEVVARNGVIALPGDLRNGSARLWVVKEASRPLVMYTDGAIDRAASIDDGKWDGKRLVFTFARKAWVYSPVKPKSVVVDGAQATYAYDDKGKLLVLEKTAGDDSIAAISFD